VELRYKDSTDWINMISRRSNGVLREVVITNEDLVKSRDLFKEEDLTKLAKVFPKLRTPNGKDIVLHFSDLEKQNISVRRMEDSHSIRYKTLGYCRPGESKMFDGLRITNHCNIQ
jgi:hypothetical protein